MKKYSFQKDNRGAAMVTAIITIMFIAILGSTLISMAYSNYIMKVNNYKAKDNFYNAEIALNEIKATLQSSAKTGGFEGMCTTLGLNSASTGAQSFNVATKFASYYPVAQSKATGTGNSVTVTSTTNQAVVSKSAKTIVIEDVMVTSTINGYESNIVTDLVLNFPTGGTYNLNVNDFSVLADGGILVGSEGYGSGELYGYVYCGKTEGLHDGSYGVPTALAMSMCSQVSLNVLSESAIFNGDVFIRDAATLNLLGGTVIITGNLYLADEATLICATKLRIGGQIIKVAKAGEAVSQNITILGEENIVQNVPVNLPLGGASSDSMTAGLFKEFQVWYNKNGVWTPSEPMTVADLRQQDNKSMDTGYTISIPGETESYRAILYQMAGTQAISGFHNTLFLTNGYVNVEGVNENSTFLTTSKVYFRIQKRFSYTKMDDACYEALKLVDVPGMMWTEEAFTPGQANGVQQQMKVYELTGDNSVYATARNLQFGDFLVDDSEASIYLNSIFNAANPDGGDEVLQLSFANWQKNVD